mmetsp:Transcript_3878/g.11348  ORF Transcript_3878/g.11348 Transcript_3878/m.11348 type:complete len:223 (-) Transcript_3878:20-688(-)
MPREPRNATSPPVPPPARHCLWLPAHWSFFLSAPSVRHWPRPLCCSNALRKPARRLLGEAQQVVRHPAFGMLQVVCLRDPLCQQYAVGPLGWPVRQNQARLGRPVHVLVRRPLQGLLSPGSPLRGVWTLLRLRWPQPARPHPPTAFQGLGVAHVGCLRAKVHLVHPWHHWLEHAVGLLAFRLGEGQTRGCSRPPGRVRLSWGTGHRGASQCQAVRGVGWPQQ